MNSTPPPPPLIVTPLSIYCSYPVVYFVFPCGIELKNCIYSDLKCDGKTEKSKSTYEKRKIPWNVLSKFLKKVVLTTETKSVTGRVFIMCSIHNTIIALNVNNRMSTGCIYKGNLKMFIPHCILYLHYTFSFGSPTQHNPLPSLSKFSDFKKFIQRLTV